MSQQQKPDIQSEGVWTPEHSTNAGVEALESALYARERRPMIVFDLDGTLLDSYAMSIECHRRVIEAMGLPPVSQRMLELLNGPNAEQECQLLGLPVERAPELMAVMARVDEELVPTGAKLFPGVLDMLLTLQRESVLCLLTNGLPSYMRAVCDVTGIGSFFAERAGFALGVTKAMRLTEWAQKHHALRVLMVGDRHTDVEAAREAGVQSIAVTYGSGPVSELRAADQLAGDVDALCRACLAFCRQE